MNRLQNCVMNVQGMLTCTYHPKPHAVISVYGWRSQARKAAILVSPKGPPFNIQITLLHYCVRVWKINQINASQQVLCKLLFIYYLHYSTFFGTYQFRNDVCSISSKKTITGKVLAKQTESVKTKVDKNVILIYICSSINCLLFCRQSAQFLFMF